MTAAHCVENDDVKSLTVRLGVWDIKNNNVGKTVALKSIKIHEGYSKYTHDVAILELSTPVKFDKTIRPVCMPAENSLKDYNGQETIAAGWGYTLGKRDGKLSKLREAKVNVITNKECKKCFKMFQNHLWLSHLSAQDLPKLEKQRAAEILVGP